MIDFQKILTTLKAEAIKVAEAVELEKHLEQGQELAGDMRERLDTDPKARLAAAGAGGLLLAGLLGTKGGRNMVGGVAKTGAVAALGALAYRVWQQRADGQENSGAQTDQAALSAAGFISEGADDPAFSEAIVRVMIAAAHADGVLDEAERAAIDGELTRFGASEEERALLVRPISENALFAAIGPAIRSPNHAAQLYGAASIVAGAREDGESAFLRRLAERLGVAPKYAAAMDRALV